MIRSGLLGGVGERAVVRGGERRLAVGLVEAEREGALDPDPIEDGEQLVGPAAHAVDVVTEVRVGVEEDGAGGNLREHALRDVVQDPLGSLEWLHRHEL